ncbi:uncharacterized protein HD556DRAFT_1314851 [Suillus plorans]|uniref:Uncharacterized protein n=1 Tax=Suillus plorans TaxID=116603 RepID=A0A9P7DA69_9AGAM|nr:uncharacterized protein HD556DRAFT_1314851 [Suillus plorans]KAG1784728.1 hypothetical protein HD556DRAFT_1314851 [Suillus plorans]
MTRADNGSKALENIVGNVAEPVEENSETFNSEVGMWWGGRRVGRKKGGEKEGWDNRNLAPTIYVALGCRTTFVACTSCNDIDANQFSLGVRYRFHATDATGPFCHKPSQLPWIVRTSSAFSIRYSDQGALGAFCIEALIFLLPYITCLDSADHKDPER